MLIALMEKRNNVRHTRTSFLNSTSYLLERASYFGLVTIISIYILHENFTLSAKESFSLYSWIMSALIFTRIFGALIGDLLIGNKKAIVLGGILKAIGAFAIGTLNLSGLYIGLALFILGSGLYTPNMIADYGKNYLDKTKLLDSGYTIFFIAANIGGFLGPIIMSFDREFGWSICFIINGVLMLVAILVYLLPQKDIIKTEMFFNSKLSQQTFKWVGAILLVGIYKAIRTILDTDFKEIGDSFEVFADPLLPGNFTLAVSSGSFLLLLIPFAIIWTYFYSNQLVKIGLGFVLGAISILILFLVPMVPSYYQMTVFIISLFLLSISEIHITPIINSVIIQYSNPKYHAIFISLSLAFLKLCFMLSGLFIG